MDVGENRQTTGSPGSLESAKPFVQARPPAGPQSRAVGLIEAGFEAHRNTEIVLEPREYLGHPGQHVAGLDHARPGDEEGRAPEGPRHQRELRASSSAAARAGAAARRRSAAAMKPANSGCGRVGRDFSSGWNWQPMNQAWSGSSITSTNPPSGDCPESRSPYSANTSR